MMGEIFSFINAISRQDVYERILLYSMPSHFEQYGEVGINKPLKGMGWCKRVF